MELVRLPVSAPERERYRFSPAIAGLPALPAGQGLLRPLDAVRIGKTIHLVDGFRRLAAALEAGTEQISCLVRSCASPAEGFLTALGIRFGGEEPDATEKALIMKKLASEPVDERDREHCRRAAGLPGKGPLAEIAAALSVLDNTVLSWLHGTRASLKQLRGMERTGHDIALSFLTNTAYPLGLNANQTRRALELLGDIRLAGGDTGPFLTASETGGKNHALAVKDFFTSLEKARYPEFSELAGRFDTLAASRFPGMTVGHNNFDSERLSFRFEAASAEEAARKAAALAEKREDLEDLFALTGGDPA